MAQRLVRAKRKITTAGIPFTIPELDQLAPRLDDVLTVIYLTYNAGYLDPSAAGQALTEDAVGWPSSWPGRCRTSRRLGACWLC